MGRQRREQRTPIDEEGRVENVSAESVGWEGSEGSSGRPSTRKGRVESVYQRRTCDGKAAKGAVDGHRRGWGYIVEFPHPMYFYPSSG